MTIPRLQLIDHCFEKTNPRLAAEAEVFPGKPDRGGKWGTNWGDYVESIGAVAHQFDAVGPNREERTKDLDGIGKAVQRKADLSARQRAAQFARTSADSDYLHVAPGYRFDLTDADAEDNGNYLIVAIDHDYRLAEGETWQIGNRLNCLRSETPFVPPPRAPRPQIRGLHSAIVWGPKDNLIWTDHYGRVQVRFFWEDGEEHTCWLRVAQTWAGDGFGALATPRVGHEVLIGFLYGDPDQPVVMKSLYNANNLPPCDPSKDPAVSGFTTRTNKPGAKTSESNHLLFVDADGKEQVHLHAQNHAHISAESAMVQTVGWGAGDTGALSFLSGSSQSTAGNVWSDIKQSIFGGGSWKAGLVSKVKGVERHSVWGHEIDVTLGTSHDFVVGAWSRGNVGLGVSLDVGFRADVMIGFDVSLHFGPHTVYCIGDRFDYTTGKRLLRTAKDLIQVVGQDFVEKIAKERITLMGSSLTERLIHDGSGTRQLFDVSGFHVVADGPVPGSPDATELQKWSSVLESAKMVKQVKSKYEFEQNAFYDIYPQLKGIKNPDESIEKATERLNELNNKYGIQIIDSTGGILIGCSGDDATIWIIGDEIEFNCSQFNLHAMQSYKERLGDLAKSEILKAKQDISRFQNFVVKPALGATLPEAKAKLLTAAGAGVANAAVSIPGIAIAGAAVAGSVVAPTVVDPNQWGL